jgi:hypothetical protein
MGLPRHFGASPGPRIAALRPASLPGLLRVQMFVVVRFRFRFGCEPQCGDSTSLPGNSTRRRRLGGTVLGLRPLSSTLVLLGVARAFRLGGMRLPVGTVEIGRFAAAAAVGGCLVAASSSAGSGSGGSTAVPRPVRGLLLCSCYSWYSAARRVRFLVPRRRVRRPVFPCPVPDSVVAPLLKVFVVVPVVRVRVLLRVGKPARVGIGDLFDVRLHCGGTEPDGRGAVVAVLRLGRGKALVLSPRHVHHPTTRATEAIVVAEVVAAISTGARMVAAATATLGVGAVSDPCGRGHPRCCALMGADSPQHLRRLLLLLLSRSGQDEGRE